MWCRSVWVQRILGSPVMQRVLLPLPAGAAAWGVRACVDGAQEVGTIDSGTTQERTGQQRLLTVAYPEVCIQRDSESMCLD